MAQAGDAGDSHTLLPQARRYSLLAMDFVKYGAASGLALALDYGVLMVTYKAFGLYYLLASAVGFLSGLLLIFVLSIRFVFSGRRIFRPGFEFLGFVATGLTGLLLNQFLMWLFVQHVDVPIALAKIPTAGVVFVFNFAARRILLFAPPAAD